MKSRILPLAFAALLAPSLTIGCGFTGPTRLFSDEKLFNTSTEKNRTHEIKAELRALAHANAENKETRQQVRSLIDERLAELIKIQGEITDSEKAALSVGTWNQLWSDEDNPQVVEPPNITKVETQVYQVILENSSGYNFGLRRGPFGEGIFIIRFDIASEAGSNVVTFTNTYFRQGGFSNNEDLSQLAQDISAGVAPNVVERQAARFPNGPIGSQSPLITDYVDSDFRIVTVPNSVTNRLDLFVLERTQASLFDFKYQDDRRLKETTRLKKELTAFLATAKESETDLSLISAEVKKKVEVLSLITPPSKDLDEQFQSLVGAWRLLWSNENVVSNAAPKPTKVYQIITESKKLINLGQRQLLTGDAVFALTSPVSVRENAFFIEFDKAYLRNSGFVTGESLAEIGRSFESDPALSGFAPRESGRFPAGPIGATDLLINQFNDGLLRVTVGTNAATGAEEIFILEKAELAD